jgi:hypothetical protein
MATTQLSSFEWIFNWDKLQSRLDNLKVDLDTSAAEEGLDNIGKAAVREVHKFIETRGTAWSSYRYNKLGRGNSAGRNDTGRMKAAVDYEVIDDSVIFGWIYDQEDYFIYQEEGTTGTRSITPMFALRDAATLVNKIGPGLVGISVSKAIREAGF